MDRFYFDHNASTPVSPAVLEAHVRALRDVYGNPSSIHQVGQMARQQLDSARGHVADLLGASRKDIVFTSGGTESVNLAIFGRMGRRETGHIITSEIEHPAVLKACAELDLNGSSLTKVRVGSAGVVDPDDVARAIRPDTQFISIMHVNNETGVVQPVEAIANVAQAAGVLFHSDGVQAAGRIPVNLKELGPDLYSISGHKLYGPKGSGALWVSPGTTLKPMLYGGRHENGVRAGTENVPGAVALGEAARQCKSSLHSEGERLASLRNRLEAVILDRVPQSFVNGTGRRVPNTSSICFEGIEGEALVIALDLRGFAVSSGSACSSGAVEPSHVLLAMGRSKEQARSSVRFSLGASNTVEQVDALADAIGSAVGHLRKVSATYV